MYTWSYLSSCVYLSVVGVQEGTWQHKPSMHLCTDGCSYTLCASQLPLELGSTAQTCGVRGTALVLLNAQWITSLRQIGFHLPTHAPHDVGEPTFELPNVSEATLHE
jgi:hypothetical protein